MHPAQDRHPGRGWLWVGVGRLVRDSNVRMESVAHTGEAVGRELCRWCQSGRGRGVKEPRREDSREEGAVAFSA